MPIPKHMLSCLKQTICWPKVITTFGPSMARDKFAFFDHAALIPRAYIRIENGPAGADALFSTRLCTIFNDDAIPTRAALWVARLEQEIAA